MAGPLDHQIGLGLETVYGTAVTPDRFYEWDMGASKHTFDPRRVQGSGAQVGDGGFKRADRSVAVVGQSSITLGLDVQSRGMGRLWKAALGASTSTLVTAGVYQQVHSTGLTGALLDSLTAQLGIVRSDAAGTVDPYTYPGCTVKSFELSCETDGVLKAKFELDGLTPATGTALATASYPALVSPFHFGHGAAALGGSLVLPTTTALASGLTASPNVRSMTLSVDNGLIERGRFGGRNQPRAGERKATLKLVIENDGTTIRDALLGHTTVPITITFTSGEQLAVGQFATLQIVAPGCKLPSGDLPQPSADPVYEVEFDLLKPAAGQTLYIVTRTADAAL